MLTRISVAVIYKVTDIHRVTKRSPFYRMANADEFAAEIERSIGKYNRFWMPGPWIAKVFHLEFRFLLILFNRLCVDDGLVVRRNTQSLSQSGVVIVCVYICAYNAGFLSKVICHQPSKLLDRDILPHVAIAKPTDAPTFIETPIQHKSITSYLMQSRLQLKRKRQSSALTICRLIREAHRLTLERTTANSNGNVVPTAQKAHKRNEEGIIVALRFSGGIILDWNCCQAKELLLAYWRTRYMRIFSCA